MKKRTLLLLLFLYSFSLVSQNKRNNIKFIADTACECIKKIDVTLNKTQKSEEIFSCIETSNSAYQLENQLLRSLKKTKDTLKDIRKTDSLSMAGENINIILNDNNYKEIEKYVYDNCKSLENIYFSDQTEHTNSVSNRKRALKFYDIGIAAFKKENYKKAIKYYKKAVKVDTSFAFAWDNLGYSYRRLNDFENAIQCYKKSIALDKKGKMPLMNIAVAYQMNNQIEKAITAYKTYRNYYKDDPESFYGLGRILFIKKDYKPALENMVQAYYLYADMNSPYKIDAEKHIAFIYKELKNLDKLAVFNEVTSRFGLTVNFED